MKHKVKTIMETGYHFKNGDNPFAGRSIHATPKLRIASVYVCKCMIKEILRFVQGWSFAFNRTKTIAFVQQRKIIKGILLMTFALSAMQTRAQTETMASFPEGNDKVSEFLAQCLDRDIVLRTGKEGVVKVRFIVETDGSISNVVVRSGVCPELDAEAVRVVKLMPRWIPGTQNGKAVRVPFSVPIAFRLDGKSLDMARIETALNNLTLQSNFDIPQQSGYSELIKQGLDLMKQEKHTDAAAFFNTATKKAPPARYRNEGWFYLGEAFFREGDYQTAWSAFMRYVRAVDVYAPVNNLDGDGCTHVPLDGWACMSRERWHFLYNYMAMCYYKLGNKENALKNFEWANGMDTKGKIVDRDRQSYAKATSLYNRGVMLKEMGRTDEAASDFAEAWKIKLDWKQSWPAEYEENVTQFLTQYYESAGNYGSLLTVLNRVPDSDRTAEQFNKAAFASFKLGNFENADKYYDKALSLQPSIAIDLEARQTSQKNAAEIREKERLRQAEIECQRREAEARRVAGIKQAQIGDKLLYSESWQWSEGLWIFHQSGTYTMMVTCFIERVEGDRYQLRVGDVQSSSSDRYTSPTINGVKVSKGDIIWARPMNDPKWVYGE
jgi:TonB family protein